MLSQGSHDAVICGCLNCQDAASARDLPDRDSRKTPIRTIPLVTFPLSKTPKKLVFVNFCAHRTWGRSQPSRSWLHRILQSIHHVKLNPCLRWLRPRNHVSPAMQVQVAIRLAAGAPVIINRLGRHDKQNARRPARNASESVGSLPLAD